MTDLDKKLELLRSFKNEYSQLIGIQYSESDTRSKIIDFLFTEILDWTEKDITREGHGDTGFFDYIFSIPGYNMVVEAKKAHHIFTLPKGRKITSFNAIFKENKEVIQQIRGYQTDTGIPYGIITNGEQFIIGKFINTNGVDWKKNTCLIFNGLDDIENRFIEFWNNLSKENIIENGGLSFLNEGVTSDHYDKIISSLTSREKEITRNNLSSEITPLIEKVFGEIFKESNDDEEFIKECFISNDEIKKNRSEIERLFGDNTPDLSEVIPAKNINSLVTQIDEEINSIPISLKEEIPPKPIIIVGTKGAGKTTFINYLFKNKLGSNTLEKHPYVYVDFRKYFNQDKTVDTEKVAFDILESLYEKYSDLQLHSNKVLKRVYIKEIKRKDESVWEDLKEHDHKEYKRKLNEFLEEKTKNTLDHFCNVSRYLIRERRLRLLIVFDNADQFEPKLQEKVFLFANSINRTALCGALISLREGYYYKWRNSPPFDAFESNVYHITAPKYSDVLQRRIDYTLNKLEADGFSVGTSTQGLNIKMDNQNVFEFLYSLKNSLFCDKNEEIIDFLTYSTFPNVREGLRLFKLFLVSGYTDVSKYIMRVRFNSGSEIQSIPIHEFIKSIALHNKLYYNHDISALKNIFYPVESSNDHFIKCFVLNFLQKKLDDGGASSKFHRVNYVLDYFVDLGYKLKELKSVISELLKHELIETEEMLSDIEWKNIDSLDFNICLTAKGSYYYKVIKNRFYYIDLILQDTPIFDKNSYEQIRNKFPKANENGHRILSERLETAKLFVDYLKKQENSLSYEVLSVFGRPTEDIFANGFSEDIERVNKNIPNTLYS